MAYTRRGDNMEDIAKVLEGISAEVSSLKEQRHAAQAEAERAAERLKEISDRKLALASRAFLSKKGGVEELLNVMDDLAQVLDTESEVLSRTKYLAEDVTRELDRLILEAEVRYHEAEKRLARGRYEALCKERYALDDEAEKAVSVLIEVLGRLEDLYEEQVRAAADADNSYLTSQDPHDTIENWLARRLRRWLSLATLEKYEEPLPELDPLTLKPEPERETLGVRGADARNNSESPGTTSERFRHPLAED
jgi:hypothetical protein